MAGEHGIPLIGMNDSAGAYVPSGVGGLDGYSEAFAAMRKISGVVPSVQLMFGYNAGGGAYLPRQGSFVIQPEDTFFGLTGPDVVREALGEDISARVWCNVVREIKFKVMIYNLMVDSALEQEMNQN